MLSTAEYLVKFQELQKLTVDVTQALVAEIAPGQTEKQIADRYYQLLAERGFTEHWYPILVYAGAMTGQPISRRIHLPSSDVVVQPHDIVFVDSTPMQDTIWTNWCATLVVGQDDFFTKIISDTKEIVVRTAEYGRTQAQTVGDLYAFGTQLIAEKGLTMLDPYQDIGHSIFQVPAGQTVDKTPMADRLLLNQEFVDRPLSGIISIEPQLGRVNPGDGKMYGAKTQEVVIFR
jgi:Xaa-Pro aminopeptidase